MIFHFNYLISLVLLVATVLTDTESLVHDGKSNFYSFPLIGINYLTLDGVDYVTVTDFSLS